MKMIALTALFPSLDGWLRSTRKVSDTTPCLKKWREFLDGSGVAGAVHLSNNSPPFSVSTL